MTLDYRLAPDHPFPAALEDTVSAYQWMIASGIPADNIGIAGDSAGGNLALAACMRLRDQREPLPAGLVLLSPWVDLTCTAPSMESNANPQHLAQRTGLLHSAGTYLGSEDAELPAASPLFGDLSGLPPCLIQVGSRETLVDDSVRLKQRLDETENQVQLHIYEGMVHEWHLLSALLPEDEALPEADQAFAEIASFVHRVVKS